MQLSSTVLFSVLPNSSTSALNTCAQAAAEPWLVELKDNKDKRMLPDQHGGTTCISAACSAAL